MTARCQLFLAQGLAPSTRRVYLSAQRRYAHFCRQEGRLGPGGALVPADEQSLMRFAALLADNLHHSSIKVYLSAVRSLHIDNGLLDPLVNPLQLQRLLRGIKRVQGSYPRLASRLRLISFRSFSAPQTCRSLTISCSGQCVALDFLVSCVLASSPLTLRSISHWLCHLRRPG